VGIMKERVINMGNNAAENKTDLALSANNIELLNILAEIIAYDIIRNIEKNLKEGLNG